MPDAWEEVLNALREILQSRPCHKQIKVLFSPFSRVSYQYKKGFKLTFPDTRRKLLKRAIPISLSCIPYITVNAHNICSFTHRFPVRLLYASQTQRCFDETGERGQTAILLLYLSSVFDRNLSTVCVKF